MSWADDVDRVAWEEGFEDEAIARMDLRAALKKVIWRLSPEERRVLLSLVVGSYDPDDRKTLSRLRRKLVATTFRSERP